MKTNYVMRALSIIGAIFIVIAKPAFAMTYATPADGDNIIGTAEYTTAAYGETLVDIAQRFDLGVNSITDANPDISSPVTRLSAGTRVQIPSTFLLPPLGRKGIIINLSEMRLYYFPTPGVVKTYPIGIGRVGKTIPIAETSVARKAKDPVWIPPADIIEFNQKQGITLPRIMPAGPDNPLGPYAIYLKIPTYLIHSTIFPESVGRRASFGCIRMHESDIKDFFPLVQAGTPVTIVDMPIKTAWQGNSLFLETHDPLEEHSEAGYANYNGLVDSIAKAINNRPAFVDWQMAADLAENRDGMPHEIGFNLD